MESDSQLFCAAWVCPISAPPIRDGAILVSNGLIQAVGNFKALRIRRPKAQVVEHSNSTIVPGLVNAHTHLELTEFACGDKPASFVQWLGRLVPRGQTSAESIRDSVARSIPLGVAQCLKFGVTTVGDISRHCAVSRPLLKSGPLNVVSYGEIQAMAQRRTLLEERIATAIDPKDAAGNLTIALSPHAPYSIEAKGYRRCLEVAQSRNLPLATHLAETPDEKPFLSDHSGAFRDLWTYIGAWDDSVSKFQGGPIRFAKSLGLLDYPALLAHVNYCDDDEMALLADGKASVVYCPRTHAFFNHPPHRWQEMLEKGINVALGTDSCASSPDLNLLEEMRVIRSLAPDLDVSRIWEMATFRAARAIRSEHKCGLLETEKRADMAVFETTGNDPLAAILDSGFLPSEIYVGGKRVGADLSVRPCHPS